MAADLPPPDPMSRVDAPAEDADARPPARERGARAGWVLPLAIGAGLLLAGIVGASLWEGITGDDGADAPDAEGWNAIAAVDAGGEVVLYDGSGSETARIDSGVGQPELARSGPRTIALSGANGAAALIDVDTGDVTALERPAGSDFVTAAGPVPVPILAGSDLRAVWVPGEDGELIDVAAETGWGDSMFAPLGVTSVDEGSTLVLANLDPAEAAIVDVEDGEIVTVPGELGGADDDGVVIGQRGEGAGGRLTRFDLDGEAAASADVDVSLVAVMPDGDDALTALTDEGAVLRVDLADGSDGGGSSQEIGQLDIDAGIDQVTARFGGDPRVVVYDRREGPDQLDVIGPDGTSVGPVAFDASDDEVPILLAIGQGDDACAVASGGDATVILRVADGTVLHTLDEGLVPGAISAGFCTLVTGESADVVVTPDRRIELADGDEAIALSPDGQRVAIARSGDDGRTVVVVAVSDVGDDGAIAEDADVVELGDVSGVQFVQRDD